MLAQKYFRRPSSRSRIELGLLVQALTRSGSAAAASLLRVPVGRLTQGGRAMQRFFILSVLFAALLLPGVTASSPDQPAYDDDGVRIAEAGLNPHELAGAEIWYKATAESARFTTYGFQQRLRGLGDWDAVVRSDRQP